MKANERKKIAGLMLATLGVGLIVVGIVGGEVPPVLTGAGFFIATWALVAREESDSK